MVVQAQNSPTLSAVTLDLGTNPVTKFPIIIIGVSGGEMCLSLV